MKKLLIALLIGLPLALFSQSEYDELLIPGIDLPTANAGAELEDEADEEGNANVSTSKIYLKVNLNSASSSKEFSYKNSFIDPNIWEKPFEIIFNRQGNNLWSIETIVKDSKLSKISINGQFTNSNIVLAQFASDGTIEWLTDIAGNRVTDGEIAFNLHLLYADGRDQVLLISLGQFASNSAISMTSDSSAVLKYQKNG